MAERSNHVERNRVAWNGWAADYVNPGRERWLQCEPSWGRWGVPEAQLRVLPDELDGLDAIELGAGTGYVSSWLARRGELIALLRTNGFEILELIEVWPPDDSTSRYPGTLEWAQRWPCEEIWKARRSP